MEALRRVATSRGKGFEELIAEALSSYMEKEERVEFYLSMAEEYVVRSAEQESLQDLGEAGEFMWRAVAYSLRAFAESQGRPVETFQDYLTIAEFLSLGEESLHRDYLVVERMHSSGRHMDFEALFQAKASALRVINSVRERLGRPLLEFGRE